MYKIKKTNYSSFNNIQKHIEHMHICKKQIKPCTLPALLALPLLSSRATPLHGTTLLACPALLARHALLCTPHARWRS
jgi:hypothetical protein